MVAFVAGGDCEIFMCEATTLDMDFQVSPWVE